MFATVMPLPAAKPPGRSRFSYEDVTAEISKAVAHAPRGTKKSLAAACGVDSAGFSHRMTGYRGERFTVEQLGAIADELQAPTGWPFLSWTDAEAYDALRRIIDGAKK